MPPAFPFRRRPRRAPGSGLLVAAVIALLGLAAAGIGEVTGAGSAAIPPASSTPTPWAGSAETPATPTAGSALGLLASLPVKGRAPQTGYDRDERFGEAWIDVDGNGCDTRNDILARDLTGIVRSGDCRVLSGDLLSPYTGSVMDFVRGEQTSALVQVDHVVALSNAWQTGAQQLTQRQRIRLANDPLNLLAVDGSSNQQKGDGDAATWLPRHREFRCEYVARQVSVKAAYGLWVTPAEHDAIARVLQGCPGQPALNSALPGTAG